MKLENRDAILSAIKAGQRSEGGWSKDDGPPDLGASYRVTRALYMMREKPDLDRLLAFIKGCRQSDGSYASTPGGTGDMGGTYTATIITRWARLLSACRRSRKLPASRPWSPHSDLTGWEGDKDLWSVRDGMIIGHSPGINHNEFLATTRPYGDFVLALNFRMVDGKGNSGVQFRSVRIANREMSGYQADIGEGYWGCLYDESRRNKVLVHASEAALKALNKSDWNHYTVRASGDDIVISLGGAESVRYRETDKHVARAGLLAVQIHAGGPMEVQFSDVMIQELPTPTAQDVTKPGFHLRTLKTEGGERKYSVYVPEGYDGSKKYPVDLVPARCFPARAGWNHAGAGGAGAGDPAPERRRARRGRVPAGSGKLGGRRGRRQGRTRGIERRDDRLCDRPQASGAHWVFHGRTRKLGAGNRPSRKVCCGRADLRTGPAGRGVAAEPDARVDLLRRRRSRRDRAQPASHDHGAPA